MTYFLKLLFIIFRFLSSKTAKINSHKVALVDFEFFLSKYHK